MAGFSLKDALTEVLGGKRLVGSDGLDYGAWSPNGIRSVGIFPDFIFVEFHPGYGQKIMKFKKLNFNALVKGLQDNPQAYRTVLDVLHYKKLMTLEEVIVDVSLQCDLERFLSKVDHKARLRAVSEVAITNPQTLGKLFSMLSAQHVALRQQHPESSWVEIFKMPVTRTLPAPGYQDWFARFALNPKLYSSDRKDGKLYQHFASVARQHGVSKFQDGQEQEQTYTPSQNANLMAHKKNVEADSANSALRSLYTLLSTARSESSDLAQSVVSSAESLLKDKSAGRVVPGLRYYLDSFGESSTPGYLVSAYEFTSTCSASEDKPSSASMTAYGSSGYFSALDSSALNELVRDFSLARVKENKFVYDTMNVSSLQDLLKNGVSADAKSSALQYVQAHGVGLSALRSYVKKLTPEEGIKNLHSLVLRALEPYHVNLVFNKYVQEDSRRVLDRKFVVSAVDFKADLAKAITKAGVSLGSVRSTVEFLEFTKDPSVETFEVIVEASKPLDSKFARVDSWIESHGGKVLFDEYDSFLTEIKARKPFLLTRFKMIAGYEGESDSSPKELRDYLHDKLFFRTLPDLAQELGYRTGGLAGLLFEPHKAVAKMYTMLPAPLHEQSIVAGKDPDTMDIQTLISATRARF